MPLVNEIMSTQVRVIEPEATLREAAQLMRDLDVGVLPVVHDQLLLGIVTDRDITVRGVATGLAPEIACVADVMTEDPEFCTEDQDTMEVMRMMGEAQLHRLPVINVDKELVGIVSIGDLALRQPGAVDETVRQIAEPT